jgi:hypothetical protein
MDVTYRTIGVVRSPFTAVEGMPIQPSRAQDVEGTLEIDPEFHAGLKDLDGFSHVLLVCHLHRVSGSELTVVPFLDTERGIRHAGTEAAECDRGVGTAGQGVTGGRVQVLDVVAGRHTDPGCETLCPGVRRAGGCAHRLVRSAARKNGQVTSDNRFS